MSERAIHEATRAERKADQHRDIGAIALDLLERQAAEFAQASHLQDGFLSELSQACRTSLTLILGPLERVLAGEFGRVAPAIREHLVHTNQHARQLLWVIEQIDEISLLASNQFHLDVRRQDLVSFLRKLTQRFQRSAKWKKIDLRFEAAGEGLNISFSENALNKAFSNLISFALKRTPPGGAVCVAFEPEGFLPDAYATVTICDTGPTLTTDQVPGLFDGFSQAGSDPGNVEMGLGLFIARELVKRSGGTLSVASEPERGTLFTVRLPKEGIPVKTGALDEAPPRTEGDVLPDHVSLSLFDEMLEGAEEPEALGRQTILLAIDSRDMRAYLGSCLGAYRVVEAAEGAMALRKIRRQPPDLIVCDVMLPGIGGSELLRRLKAHPQFADIPFILVTNRISEELKVQMLEAGAAEYLIEPFRAAELQAKIHNILEMEEREKKARDLAQQAQLQMLRYQLNPHFLFNALNAIRALVLSDATRSRQVVTALSEYLRYSLRTANDLEVSLKEELTSLRSYLDIEKIRFEEDLEVCFEIEPEASGCMVLSVLLQPLVENAIKYGMQTSSMPLRIRLLGTIRDHQLHLEVANTGRWLTTDETDGRSTRIGLRNLRQRLDHFYPARHSFAVIEQDGWVRATIDIDLG